MRLAELAALLEGELRGDADLECSGVSGLEGATPDDLSFIADAGMVDRAAESKALCILVAEFHDSLDKPQIKVDDPHLAFAGLLERFRPRQSWAAGVSELAYVDPEADIAPDASVNAFAYVSAGASVGPGSVICPGVFMGQGSRVGSDCLIYPGVALMDGVVLADRVIVHAGTVIGSDGYGYIQRGGRHVKVPQVGGVLVEDDVEIGANCTIDRATTDSTVIGAGSKLDNMVQIAHNVTVGAGSLLTAQVGVAGSSKIGRNVIMAGQSGVKDHVSVADGAILAGRCGVTADIREGGAYAGMPAIPIRDWLKSSAMFSKLPDLSKKIRQLERRLEEIEKKGSE